MLKLVSDANLKIDLVESRFEELNSKVQKDREFLDTRLSRIDDSAVIKKWVENLLVTLKYETSLQIDNLEKHSKQVFETIWKENLLIPGLIGEREQFRNMSEYIINEKTTTAR